MRNSKRPGLILTVCLALTGCAPPAEQAADYVTDGRLLLEAGDLVSAKLELKNALQIQPKNAEARYLLALAHEREEEYEKAIGNLEIAVEADPEHIDARLMLGKFYALGRLADKTREQAEAVMALTPQRAEARLLNANALYLDGDASAALEEARRAIALDPTHRASISFASALLADAGAIEGALATIDAGLAQVNRDDAEALRRARVAILRLTGDSARVEEELLALAREYPATSEYKLELLRTYVAADRQDDAEQMVRELIRADPDNAEWRIQLAGLLVLRDRSAAAEASLLKAIRDNPDSVTLKLALGGFYESAGRGAEARTIYESVADTGPRTDEGLAARNRIAAGFIGEDDDRARKLINEILVDAPDNVDALLARAAYSIQRNQYREAVADLQLARAKQPDSERILLLLARAHLAAGDASLAEDSYRRLVAINPTNRAASNELAVLLGNRGSTEEAEDLLRQTLERAPGDAGASRNLVKALLQQQDFAAAEAEAQRIIELGEASGVADYQLGEALEAQGKLDQAEAAYRNSLRKNPMADRPLGRLAALLVRNGRSDEAEAYLVEHIERHAQHIQARLLLGDVYRQSGAAEKSRQVLEKLITEHPDVAGAYLGLAALHPDGSSERIEVLQDGVDANPAEPGLALALGNTHKMRGEYEQAITVYERAFQINGENDFVANNLASLLLDYRNEEESHARALEIASRFARGDAHPLNLGVLGWAHYRNAQYPQAVRYLERAVAGAGQNPLLRYYLGMAYLKSDNAFGAEQELQKAIEIADAAGATFAGIDEAQAALTRLRSAG